MEIQYKGGKLLVDVLSLVEYLDEEAKLNMMRALSCDTDVITRVTQQILDKWTDDGCNGLHYVVAPAAPLCGLDWAWREVAKRASDVAKREIERLEEALKSEQQQCETLRERLQRGQRY